MKTPPAFKRAAARIDAMSLRERVILFASATLLLLALADQIVITPALHQQSAWRATQERTAADLAKAREELAHLALPHAAATAGADDATLRAVQLQNAVADARATYRELSEQLSPAAEGPNRVALPALLAQVLQRHKGLTLVQLSTRPEGNESTGSTAAKPAGPTLNATQLVLAHPAAQQALQGMQPAAVLPAEAAPSAPAWQGARVSVSGSYADLRAFLVEIEHQLPGLRWGAMTLDADTSPPVMHLQLWLAGSL